MLEINQIHQGDCLELMKNIPDKSVNLTLTDIPYDLVNRKDNGLRNLNKENADEKTFELLDFIKEVDRVTKGTIIIFCGNEQYSNIYKYFSQKQKKSKGTVRQIIWGKTNPSPMNGQYIYLSGTENAVWFKNRGSTFNAHCKKNFFQFPCGRSKLHPTEKNHDLLKELIQDNSKVGDIIFDPCCGSGSHLQNAKLLDRKFIGIELDKKYLKVAQQRIKEVAGCKAESDDGIPPTNKLVGILPKII